MKTLLFALIFVSSFAFAEEMQTYQNSENHYSVSYPKTWIQRDQKVSGYDDAIELISPRHEGSLLLMPVAKGANCKEVLTTIETERKLTNLLKADEQTVIAADLQKAHAVEGLRRKYAFPIAEKTQPIEQRALCLRKASQKLILLGTFRKKNGPDMIEAMFKSFTFQDGK